MSLTLTMPQSPTESPALAAAFARKQPLFKQPAFLWIIGLSLAVAFAGFVRYRQIQYDRNVVAVAEVLRLQREIDVIRASETKIREAILRGEVVYGMSKYEVLQAKGHPDYRGIGPTVWPTYRDKGAVQTWSYDNPAENNMDVIMFDVEDRVMGFTKGDKVYWLRQAGAKDQGRE
jgi:hypothetical protein